LQGQLDQAEASLRYYATGEKASLLSEAERQIEGARIQAQEQRRVVERLRDLMEKSLVAKQEYELALAAQRVFEVNVAIAETRLASLQTGAKPEQLALLRSQIAAIEREIETLEKKAANFVLTSPIAGVRLPQVGSDTLLTIASQDTFIVAMLVKYDDRLMLKKGLGIEVTGPAGETMAATIDQIYQVGGHLDGEQLFYVSAKMPPASWLFPGLYARCRIRCQHLSKGQFLKRLLH
ncbi:hypothetical protein JXO59_08250, partial [candidate division KSB1 bacterium]|nr:hypothetical protein [candidate division KSB1 bacterium]